MLACSTNIFTALVLSPYWPGNHATAGADRTTAPLKEAYHKAIYRHGAYSSHAGSTACMHTGTGVHTKNGKTSLLRGQGVWYTDSHYAWKINQLTWHAQTNPLWRPRTLFPATNYLFSCVGSPGFQPGTRARQVMYARSCRPCRGSRHAGPPLHLVHTVSCEFQARFRFHIAVAAADMACMLAGGVGAWLEHSRYVCSAGASEYAPPAGRLNTSSQLHCLAAYKEPGSDTQCVERKHAPPGLAHMHVDCARTASSTRPHLRHYDTLSLLGLSGGTRA